MIDRILKMYVKEMEELDSKMEAVRHSKNTSEYYELFVKRDEVSRLFNRTIAIINEESAK